MKTINQHFPQTVLLLGGMFGVGKSTLANQIHDLYDGDCYNFDFANVYREKSGVALSQSKQGDIYRDSNWATTIVDSINQGIEDGNAIVIANSSFLIGERRRVVIQGIRHDTRVLPIILTPPLLVPYHRIKSGRPEGSHIVNRENAKDSIMRICKEFIESDNSDLLLPSNPYLLPKEYLSMLCRNPKNRDIITNGPSDEARRAPKWVLTPQELAANDCLELIKSGVSTPMEIRDYLEGRTSIDFERDMNSGEETHLPRASRK